MFAGAPSPKRNKPPSSRFYLACMALESERAVRPPLLGGIAAQRRLGVDQPAGWWPTTPRLKAYEAAGFQFVQVRMSPRHVLSVPEFLSTHARALRERLALTELRLILHAPDDLLAGTGEHDRQLLGAMRYAERAGAELVVYHGARVPAQGLHMRDRLVAEERSLRMVLGSAAGSGVRLAIENLAPEYPGQPYVCHDPRAIFDLVARLESERVGICLDLGHAHIASGVAGCELAEFVTPVIERVILFDVHDNFGSVVAVPRGGQIEPLRLDLHLAPGAGSLPWHAMAAVLARHPAPLQLEVHPASRPEPATLAVLACEVLGLGEAAAAEPSR
jgi:sugar phosphate isomerase/epimerase